jgi:hypothetical protein
MPISVDLRQLPQAHAGVLVQIVSPALVSRRARVRGKSGAGRPAASSAAAVPWRAPNRNLRRMHAVAAIETPRPAAAPRSWPCRRRCRRCTASAMARSSRPPARSRTGPATSRSPSAWRSRHRARCRRCLPDAMHSSGRCRGRWPTGTAPAGGVEARNWANFSAGFLIFRMASDVGVRPRRPSRGSPASPGRAPGSPCPPS